MKTFSKNLKSLLPFRVYEAEALSTDKYMMLANNCFFFENQEGIFSINDTKVSIKSIKKNQKKNIRQVTVPIDHE